MKFAFSEDQRLLAETLAELLSAECSHEALAAAWESESGHVPGLWAKLAEMGVLAASVPESEGGLGFDEVDVVLMVEELGRFACPEPVAETEREPNDVAERRARTEYRRKPKDLTYRRAP